MGKAQAKKNGGIIMPGIGIAISPVFGKKKFNYSSYWTQQYQDVLDYMTAQSMTLPSTADKIIQAVWVKKLVDAGIWAKAEFIDMFSTHSQDTSVINWHNPGTHNPIPTNSPAWEQYKGYTGATAGTKYVRLNYIPSEDAIAITKTNFTVILGCGTDLDENTRDFGGYDGQTSMNLYLRITNLMAFFGNSDYATNVANTSSIGHYSMGRNNDVTLRYSKNTLHGSYAQANNTENLITNELYACGRNNNGSAIPAQRQLRYVMMFSYLTPDEVSYVQAVTEEYLRNYSAGLISDTKAFTMPWTKTLTALTTYVEGNDETVHPSVLDLGSSWNGYRYWMANTPLPTLLGGESAYENPSIWASNNGLAWTIPAGLTNPIYPKPNGFNNDPDLYFENNVLYCLFNSVEIDGPKIVLLSSSDGVTWGDKEYVVLDGITYWVSGSLIKIGAKYYIYFVEITGEEGSEVYTIRRASSNTISGTYTDVESIVITAIAGAEYWHLDICKIDDLYWIHMTNRADIKMYLAYSTDGLNFTIPNSVAQFGVTAGSWDATGLYRPSMIKIGDRYIMYYAGNTAADGWRTGYVEIKVIPALV